MLVPVILDLSYSTTETGILGRYSGRVVSGGSFSHDTHPSPTSGGTGRGRRRPGVDLEVDDVVDVDMGRDPT